MSSTKFHLHRCPPQVVEAAGEVSGPLAALLVSRGLVPALAASPLYPALAAAALEAGPDTAAAMVDQLRAAGHAALAASLQVLATSITTTTLHPALQMEVEGVPPGLRTLAMMAQRWLGAGEG